MSACVAPVDDTGIHPNDIKPSDQSELGGAPIAAGQQGHELHYTDWSNLWSDTAYPIAGANPHPDCMNWMAYDRYLPTPPAAGTWGQYSTSQTSHNWARGPQIDAWMATIPNDLGYNKVGLVDHNTAVGYRTFSTGCTGRYIFQWDNRTYGPAGTFGANSYYVAANIPDALTPKTKAACEATMGTNVPSAQIELYVCEAPKSSDVVDVRSYCAKNSGKWRRVVVGSVRGNWSANSCGVAAGAYYAKPVGKVAVSFNAVLKTGIGHGPAPADIWLYRYN